MSLHAIPLTKTTFDSFGKEVRLPHLMTLYRNVGLSRAKIVGERMGQSSIKPLRSV